MTYKIYKKTKISNGDVATFYIIKKKTFSFFNIYVIEDEVDYIFSNIIIPIISSVLGSLIIHVSFNINYFLILSLSYVPIFFLINYLKRTIYTSLDSAEWFIEKTLKNKLLLKNLNKKTELKSLYRIKDNKIEKIENN